jgi:hypothetical protein
VFSFSFSSIINRPKEICENIQTLLISSEEGKTTNY